MVHGVGEPWLKMHFDAFFAPKTHLVAKSYNNLAKHST